MMSVSPEFFDTHADSAARRPPLCRQRQPDLAESRDPERGRGQEVSSRTSPHWDAASASRRRRAASTKSSASSATRSTHSLREPAPPTMYQMFYQGPARSMNFILRTAGDPAAMTETVRAAVRRVEPNLPLTNIATQTDQVERRFASGAAVRQRPVDLRRAGAAPRVDRAVRPDVVQRLAPDERDRHPHGARRAARERRGMVLRESLLLVGERRRGRHRAWHSAAQATESVHHPAAVRSAAGGSCLDEHRGRADLSSSPRSRVTCRPAARRASIRWSRCIDSRRGSRGARSAELRGARRRTGARRAFRLGVGPHPHASGRATQRRGVSAFVLLRALSSFSVSRLTPWPPATTRAPRRSGRR